jgi:hypothetical protein
MSSFAANWFLTAEICSVRCNYARPGSLRVRITDFAINERFWHNVALDYLWSDWNGQTSLHGQRVSSCYDETKLLSLLHPSALFQDILLKLGHAESYLLTNVHPSRILDVHADPIEPSMPSSAALWSTALRYSIKAVDEVSGKAQC